MTSTLAEIGFSQKSFDAFLDSRDEPAWLTSRRREAWSTFLAMDWPARNEEEWIRTDIRLFKLANYHLPSGEQSVSAADLPPALLATGVQLGGYATSFDSRSVESHLEAKWAKQGVLFGSLEQLVRDHSELIEKHLLTKAVKPNVDRFAALHAACWSGGGFLYVPRGVVMDEPLHLFSSLSDGGTDLGHILVILDDGAEATVLTETASARADGGGLNCGATELFVGRGARLRYVSLQDWGSKVWHFSHQTARVDADALLQWTIARSR